MIDLSSLNHYEILDVEPSATTEEIRRAYEIALRTYGTQNMATGSLFTPTEKQQILYRVHQAYKVLIDPKRRTQYDQEMGISNPRALRQVTMKAPGLFMEGDHDQETDSDGEKSWTTRKKRQAVEEIVEGVRQSGMWNGSFLRKVREALGLSVEDIASKTKISRGHIKSIEDDSFEFLPPDVYVKGFLNEIAKVLGLDPEETTTRLMEYIRKRRGVR